MYTYTPFKNEVSGGNTCFSGIHFGIAKINGSIITQEGINQKCREIFMQLLYTYTAPNIKIGHGSVNNREHTFDISKNGLTPNNSLLVCKSTYFPSAADNGIKKLNYIPNIVYTHISRFYNDVLLSFPPVYFKIPLLISYITLLIRVGSYVKGDCLKEVHENAKRIATEEAKLLAATPHTFVEQLFNNHHKINLEEHAKVLLNLFNRYSYFSACCALGITGVACNTTTASIEYAEFLNKELNK